MMDTLVENVSWRKTEFSLLWNLSMKQQQNLKKETF